MIMKRTALNAIAVLCLSGAVATDGAAQVPWESPQLLAPGAQAGLSALYVDFGLSPDAGHGVLLMYRGKDAPRGLGLRVAGTLPGESAVRLSGGLDVAVPMFTQSPAFPLDVMWISGIGASFGDYYAVSLPAGLAASRAFTGSNVWFQPYTSARVVLEGYFGADRPAESFGVALATEVGADVSLHRSRIVIIRTAMSLGDRRALAIGLQLSPGRSAAPATARAP